MSLHRGLARVELRRDLFVQQAGHDVCHDLTLALRQGFVPPSQPRQIRPLTSCRAVTINRPLNRVKQLLITKRFREEVHRTGLQGLHRHWNVTMSGDEDDWDRWIRISKFPLKIEAAQSRESHV